VNATAARYTTPRTFRNVLANWGAFVFAVGVNFFLSPFIVHRLGNTSYGIWTLLASIVGYMGLLDLGVQSALTRYVARYHATSSDREANRTVSAALAIFTAFGLVAIALSVLCAVVLMDHLHIPPDLVGVARQVLLISGLAVSASLVSGVFSGIVSAMQRFDLSSGMEIAIGAARAIAVIVAFQLGGGIIALALVQLAASVARGVVAFILSRYLYPELRPSLWNWSSVEMRMIFSFGVFASLLHISNMVVTSADSLIISAFMPVSAVTFFAIAASLVAYSSAIISAIAQTITPRVGAQQARTEDAGIEEVVLRAGRAATLIIIPIGITLVLRGKSFLGLWMGPEYADPSGDVLRPLAVALIVFAAPHVAGSALIGLNRHRELAPVLVVEAAMNVALSIYWIGTLGLVGMALATAIPRITVGLTAIPWLLKRHVGAPPSRTFVEFWLRPLAAAIPFATATWLVETWWVPSGLLMFFAQITTILPFMLAGAWLVGLTANERSAYAKALMRRFGASPERRTA
jgi:O-antigen/teichoic acid export membrane protein